MRLGLRLRMNFLKRYMRFFILFVCGFIFGVPTLLRIIHMLFSSPGKFEKTPVVVVHFDLKGAPPTLRYLGYVLRQIKDLGANAILLEYEDMFPYEKDIKNLSSPFHYQKADLIEFLQKATSLNLEVIPLIQTFGHMEYALKHEEFQHLREDPFYSDSLCPSKNGSKELLQKIIEQVILLHKSTTPLQRIHIGCDEVFRINTCPDCTKKGLPKSSLYIQHLKTVANMVTSLVPGIKILVWDDMFRYTNISLDFQNELVQLGSKYQIEPVVWDYTSTLSSLSHKHMYQYQKAFKNMWAASAYKGADGEIAVEPDIKVRLLNNLNWVKFVVKFSNIYNFTGIILTGWSRYTHFYPVCELLPVSYRSLAAILFLINKFTYGVMFNDYVKMYTINNWQLASRRYYEHAFERIDECYSWKVIVNGHRPECRLISESAIALHKHVVAYEDAIKKQRGYLDRFDLEANVKFNYMDRRYIQQFIVTSLNLTYTIENSENLVKEAMRHFFPEHVCNEYVNYKSYSAKQRQSKVNLLLKRYFKTKNLNHIVWPKGRNVTI